jgi:GNAT superfamily N-acetyltransferase
VGSVSLWADYQKERFGFDTIEVESGFIVYDIKPPLASIEDFYVTPSMRGTSLAKRLADQAIKIAKERGCTKVLARVTPGLPGADHAMRTNLHYGFKLMGNHGNDTLMSLDISEG